MLRRCWPGTFLVLNPISVLCSQLAQRSSTARMCQRARCDGPGAKVGCRPVGDDATYLVLCRVAQDRWDGVRQSESRGSPAPGPDSPTGMQLVCYVICRSRFANKRGMLRKEGLREVSKEGKVRYVKSMEGLERRGGVVAGVWCLIRHAGSLPTGPAWVGSWEQEIQIPAGGTLGRHGRVRTAGGPSGVVEESRMACVLRRLLPGQRRSAAGMHVAAAGAARPSQARSACAGGASTSGTCRG